MGIFLRDLFVYFYNDIQMTLVVLTIRLPVVLMTYIVFHYHNMLCLIAQKSWFSKIVYTQSSWMTNLIDELRLFIFCSTILAREEKYLPS